MSNEETISRRGLLMKVGILFNGLVATALAVPIVGFVLSSVTRGRANAYLSWVPLGSVSEFPEGGRGWRLSGILRDADRRQNRGHGLLGAARGRRGISGVCRELCASRLPSTLVSAIRFIYVPMPRRSVLPGWFACFGSAGTRVIRISVQSERWRGHDSGRRIAYAGITDRLSLRKETAMRRRE